ncbi:hypothetical protein LSAT2_004192 [Lamellibrachia satsuma]|nr:hypothetical protein LSAT2_004192 [Lamellibrachia satsuma]
MRKFFKNFGKDKQSKSGSGACADYYDYDSDPSKLKKLPKLHQAAWKGDVDKVQEYSKKNPNLLDKFNRTALHLACCQGKTAVIKELLEWKAKTDIVDIEGCTPIMIAVRFKHKPCVAVLVEAKANPNSHDTNEESCLHYAARTDQLDILLLLFRGARPAVNAQNKHGETPLWLAVSCQFIAIARELLQLGADVDIADETGRTPLMMACKIDLREFVYLLLEFTADTELRDANDWLAYDYAMNTKPDGACGKILAEHCARTGTGSLVQGRVVVPTDDSDDNLGAAIMQRKGSLGAGSMDSYSKKRALQRHESPTSGNNNEPSLSDIDDHGDHGKVKENSAERLAGQKVSLDNGDGRLVADDTPEKREFMLTTSDQERRGAEYQERRGGRQRLGLHGWL